MENDLIRRSDAENIFQSARRAMKPENYSGQEFFIRDNILLNAEQIVHFIPAVDAVEVRRGWWERNKLGNAVFYCSECHEGVTMYPPTQLFCYHCGARMDGEEGDA